LGSGGGEDLHVQLIDFGRTNFVENFGDLIVEVLHDIHFSLSI
jgi:hypothetical protein